MNLISLVLLCVITSSAHGGWLKELALTGLDISNGFKLHLDNNRHKNASLLEQHAVRLDYGSLGVSVGKKLNKDALEVGFFINDKVEGREKKFGEISLPMFIGFKLATVVSLTLAVITALVLKALGIAKLALVTAAGLFVSKLLHNDEGGHHHHHHHPAYVEIEPHGSDAQPIIADYPPSEAGGYHPSETSNYYAYSNYVPSAVAEGGVNYATVEASAGNTTVTGSQQVTNVAATKRRDYLRRKYKAPVFTIHRYSIET